MPKSSTPSRERIVAGAADMISRRGLSATSIREMAKHAGAPLGSTYHYFPEGKQQLAAEAVRHTGDRVARSLATELAAGPAAGLDAFVALWRRIVVDTDFHAGCPVLAVAIEEPSAAEVSPALAAAAEVFEQWEDLLAISLREHGAGAEQAAQIATLIVASVEGTVAMCRARRSTEPLDRTAVQLQTLIATAIDG
ncbi:MULTISPECIES: TetR/AcrR family transcriptional regulator [unclassified Streptomyces]|uniref:TetR/AcrR family transcriptional regulator n=1 Tax=unclassified Streptomyces TaxID=2593676 RepID=UPI002E3766C0|nr:TetR/AcrR family transcriptional regulator [Streptomyces sp. NBC_01428]